jgi:hypothetical protein
MGGRGAYQQIVEGEWIRPAMRGFVHQCCGCALTHITDYRVVEGRIELRLKIDGRRTAASRRAKRKGGANGKA